MEWEEGVRRPRNAGPLQKLEKARTHHPESLRKDPSRVAPCPVKSISDFWPPEGQEDNK